MRSEEVLDHVDRRFSAASPDLPNGFAEHAPMGVEAMLHLGIDPHAVRRWSDRHQGEPEAPDTDRALDRHALRDELATGDWRDIAAARIAPLADRCDAHLFHGLIRTAHAVRALQRHDSIDTRAELAAGLAAWTTWAGRPRHADVAGVSGDPDQTVLDAATRGAAAFVRSPSIINLHAVTGPMAWLLVSPVVDEVTRRRAAASFVRSHARHPAVDDATRPGVDRATVPTADELGTLADHWDAHPAKLVEAALRGHAATGRQEFLAAIRVVLP